SSEDARLTEEPSGEAGADHPRAAGGLLEPDAEQPALHDEDVLRRLPLGDQHLPRREGAERDVSRQLGAARGLEAGEAPGIEEIREGREARAALLEEGVDGRAGERLAATEVEGEHGGDLEGGEIEAVGELAGGGLQVPTREPGLA